MPIFFGHPDADKFSEYRSFSCCGFRYHISELKGFGDIGGPHCPYCEPDFYTAMSDETVDD